nr:hypothetical protein [uncultured Campylobacter sp.]
MQIVLLSGVVLAAAKFSALFLGRYLNLTQKTATNLTLCLHGRLNLTSVTAANLTPLGFRR